MELDFNYLHKIIGRLTNRIILLNLDVLKSIQSAFNQSNGSKKVSMADLIILAGNTAVENSAKIAGHNISISFVAGRNDATQEQTDLESFGYLEPLADGFRNYMRADQQYSC